MSVTARHAKYDVSNLLTCLDDEQSILCCTAALVGLPFRCRQSVMQFIWGSTAVVNAVASAAQGSLSVSGKQRQKSCATRSLFIIQQLLPVTAVFSSQLS